MIGPKVSVVMSVYNGERYVCEAVESVLNQTFTDFEFIIVDDGSTDGTWRILTKYAARDHRIVLLRNSENIGLPKSLNRGLRVAQGKYIARQDADDISLPDRLRKQVAVLDRNPDLVLVSANIDLMDNNGRLWRRPRRKGSSGLVAWLLLFSNYLGGHSQVMFRRQVALNLGGYAENYPCSQDYELWLRLSEIGKILILPDVLLHYRTHDESLTSRQKKEQRELSLLISQQAMARLLGEKPDLAEVVALRSFWLGSPPEENLATIIHKRLRHLFATFLVARHRRGLAEPHLNRLIAQRVAERFFVWTCALARRRKVFPALRAFTYTVSWYMRSILQRRFSNQW